MPEGQGVGQSRKRAKSRNLSCTPDITTGVLGGRLNTSRFSSSNIQHFLVCKGDPSAALGMTVRGSSLSVSLGAFDPSASRTLIKEVRVCAHHLIEERQYPWSLIPNPCFQISRVRRIALFPYRHFERSREIFLAHRISQLVFLAVGPILLVSRHQTPSVFLPARGIPRLRNAIKLSGRTFLAPHRGSSPMGLCKRTGFLGVKRRENPVRRHFERSEMRGLRSGIA